MNVVKNTGTGITYAGMGSLLLLSLAATISIDIMLLIAACTNNDNNNNRNDNTTNAFLTGYLIGSFQNNHSATINNDNCDCISDRDSLNMQAAKMLAVSTIPMSITIGVAYYLKKPHVGAGFGYAWAAAAGLTIVGLAIHAMGHQIEKCTNNPIEITSPTASSTTTPIANVAALSMYRPVELTAHQRAQQYVEMLRMERGEAPVPTIAAYPVQPQRYIPTAVAVRDPIDAAPAKSMSI